MDFTKAYLTIVKRSVERNTKELPTILSCLDFEGLNCLEIGPGPLARLAVKISGFANHITCLETNAQTVEAINKLIKEQGLEKRISVTHYEPPTSYKLPFQDKKFDLVYGAWLPHKLVTNQEFLDEISRVSSRHLLLILPGIKGDEPKLVSLIKPQEKERRLEYKQKISDYLRTKGYFLDYKEGMLKLDFASSEEIRDTFYCLAFKNESTDKQKTKVNKFLDSRTHNFKDGFYCIHAENS